MPALATCTLLAGLASASAPVELTTAPSTYYVYRDQRVELDFDPRRIAIQLSDSPPESSDASQRVRELAAQVDVALTDVRPLRAAGWHLATLASPSASPAAARDRLARFYATHAVHCASPVFHGSDPGGWFLPQARVNVRLADPSPAAVEAFTQRQRGRALRLPSDEAMEHLPGALALDVLSRNGFDALDLANELAADPAVLWAEPDALFTGTSSLTPTDTFYSELWAHANTGQFGGQVGLDMNTDAAWDETTGSEQVRIAILDVGIDFGHEDLNVVAGFDSTYDFGSGAAFNQCDNHATQVAGSAAALINGIGVVGTAPDCPLVSIRNLISEIPCTGIWLTSPTWVSAGIGFTDDLDARVTVNSNSYPFQFSFIDDIYAEMSALGIVHFASAGNSGANGLNYPGSLPNVNSVGALDEAGDLAWFSNFGSGVFGVGPGDVVWTTDRTGLLGTSNDSYAFVAGTSVAAPYIAGVAALILSKNPCLAPGAVEDILQATARDLGASGYDTTFGWGLANAADALAATPDAAVAGLVITSFDPPQIPSVLPPGATVQINGSGLLSTQSVSIGGVSFSANGLSDTLAEFSIPKESPLPALGTLPLTLTTAVCSTEIAVEVVAPPAPLLGVFGNPQAQFSPLGLKLQLAGPASTPLVLLYSWSNTPSLLPGFLDLGIGNNFSALYLFGVLPNPAPGWQDVTIGLPGSVAPGLTFYLQTVLADDTSAPIPTSAPIGVTFVF